MMSETPGVHIFEVHDFFTSILIKGQILHIWPFWPSVWPWYLKIVLITFKYDNTITISGYHIHFIDSCVFLVLHFFGTRRIFKILIDWLQKIQRSKSFHNNLNYLLWCQKHPGVHIFEVHDFFTSILIKGQILQIWPFWPSVWPWYLKIVLITFKYDNTITISCYHIHFIDSCVFLVLHFFGTRRIFKILIDWLQKIQRSKSFHNNLNYLLWCQKHPGVHIFEVHDFFPSILIKGQILHIWPFWPSVWP
jgi:hypothetical protein